MGYTREKEGGGYEYVNEPKVKVKKVTQLQGEVVKQGSSVYFVPSSSPQGNNNKSTPEPQESGSTTQQADVPGLQSSQLLVKAPRKTPSLYPSDIFSPDTILTPSQQQQAERQTLSNIREAERPDTINTTSQVLTEKGINPAISLTKQTKKAQTQAEKIAQVQEAPKLSEQQLYGPNGTFQYSFFSIKGQQERGRNTIASVSSAAVKPFKRWIDPAFNINPDDTYISANTNNRIVNNILEYGANNPYETALISASIYTAGAGVARGVGATAEGIKAAKGATATARLAAGQQAAAKAITASKAAKAAPPVLNYLRLNTAANTIAATAGGYGIAKGSIVAADVTRPEVIQNLSRKEIQQIAAQARLQEEQALTQNSPFNIPGTDKAISLPNIAAQISPAFSMEKDTYEGAIRQQLKAQGYEGKELDEAVAGFMRRRKYATAGEAAALLYLNTYSEIFGEAKVAQNFAKKQGAKISYSNIELKPLISNLNTQKVVSNNLISFTFTKGRQVFLPAAFEIGKAGFVEGFGSEVAQQAAREKPLDLKQAAVMGGYGAASAGLIGGSIVATSVRKPGISKTIMAASYITDPYEFPGDVAANLLRKSAAKATGLTYNVPVITQVSPNVFSVASKTEGGKNAKFEASDVWPFSDVKAANKVAIKNNPFTNTNTNANINPNVKAPVITQAPINPFINPNVNNNINPNINPQPNTNTNTNTNTPSDSNTPADIFQNINTNINTPVNTFVNVPVVTPQLRLPPPVPFNLPFGTGAAGARGKKKRKAIRELDISANLLQGLLSNNSVFGLPSQPKPRKKSKRRKR